MSVGLARHLPPEAITVGARAADWQEALRLAGAGLVAAGATTDAYSDEMVAAVTELGPYIVVAPGLALAHSRPSPAVLRAGLSWVGLAEPVSFGHSTNDPVDLVVGLAALDHDGHIDMMSALAAVLADEDALARLRAASSPDEVLAILSDLTTD